MKMLTRITNFKYFPLLFILFFVIVLYFLSYIQVKKYYDNSLPYYDSVGSYAEMFNVMNFTKNKGILVGINKAMEYPLSYLISFFAVFAAFILPKTPEALISLNFILLFIAQLVIYQTGASMGYSKIKSLILSFILYFPGALFGWTGGYIDMRRDASMLLLLTISFFLITSFIRQPKLITSLCLGFFLGLSIWSRGNALPYTSIVILSCFVSKLILDRRKNYIKTIITVLPGFIIFIFFTSFYYSFQLKSILFKYIYGSWGIGEGFYSAIKYFFIYIGYIFIGPSLKVIPFNLIFFLCVILFTGYLFLKNKIYWTINNLKTFKQSFVLLSGLILIIFIFILNILTLQIGKKGGYIPLYPILIGFFSIFLGLGSSIYIRKIEDKNKIKNSIFFFIVILLLLVSLIRIILNMPPIDQNSYKILSKISNETSGILSGKSVAFLWVEHLHAPDLNFMFTKSGNYSMSSSSVLTQGADIEMPPDPKIPIEEQLKKFSTGIRNREFVVLTDDLNQYDNPNGFFSIFKFGKPFIKQLILDSNFFPIYEYDYNDNHFIILKNKLILK